VRVAFLGQRTLFAAHALQTAAGGLEPAFFDPRAEDVAEALRAHRPDVVVAFRPDAVPPGALEGLGDAKVLGVVTEPLPGGGRAHHPNLDYNLAELARADAARFDRVIVTDPRSADAAAAILPVWRAMPLPVDDALFRAPRPTRRPPRIIFLGYSTMHREETLIGLKHEFDLPHYAYGLQGDDLREVLHEADAAIVVNGEAGLELFEDTILLHLAAGHLVLAERIPAHYGLNPGRDYVAVAGRDDLRLRVAQLHAAADVHDRVRIQGHHASRPFAASRVWPRVVADLLAA
jgi:hypothetical protein